METTDAVGYRSLFRHAPAAMLVLDPELTIVDVSDAYLTATARTRQDLLGRAMFEAFPDNPADPEASGVAMLDASLQRVLRERTTDVMAIQQYDIPRNGGGFDTRFWAPVNAPVCDEDGRLRWIVHRVDDVTAYVQARQDGPQFAPLREQLRTSSTRTEAEVFAREQLRQAHQAYQVLQALLDSLDTAVVGCDHEGRVVLSNDAARDLLGSAVTAVPVATWAAALHLHHPDGRPIGPDELPLIRALRGERVWDAEIVMHPPGRARRTFRVHSRPVVGQPGLAAVAALHDVTVHRRAARFRECEAEVGRAISKPEPIDKILAVVVGVIGSTIGWAAAEFWTVDDVAQVLRPTACWAEPGREPSGPSHHPLLRGQGIPGRAWQATVPIWAGDVRAEPGAAESGAAASGAAAPGAAEPDTAEPDTAEPGTAGPDAAGQSADRRPPRVALAIPIPSGSVVLGVLVCYSDLTEVPDDVRTAVLTGVGAQLGEFLERRRAERLTAELDQTRDEYIALVGHELRTPLTTIQSYTDLMLDDPALDAEHRQLLSVLQRNAETLRTLVGRLLEVAGMRSGHIQLQWHPMDLATVVRAAGDAARRSVTNAVTIDVNTPSAAAMDGDAARLRQVVDELLSNALTWAADSSTVGVHVHADELTTALAVSNTGRRITADERTRLFNLFFRGDAARHQGVPGTGLGLTLARAVVEQHGGSITVSEPDEPVTIFTVRLPTRQPVRPAVRPGGEGSAGDGADC